MPDLFFGGGLNETDPFNISTDECISGYNFVLDTRRRSFRRRPPQDLVGTATNGKPIRGIMQMNTRAGVVTTLIKAGEVVYSWDGTTFTSERSTDITTSSRYRSTYWSLDDILVVNDLDKNDPLWKWDGTDFTRLKTGLESSTTSTITSLTRSGTVATAIVTSHGWSTGDLVVVAGADQTEYNIEAEITVTGANTFTYTVTGSPASPATSEGTITATLGVELTAKYSAVKDSRVWLFNVCTDGTELPHAIVASKFEEAEVFDTAARGVSQDDTSSVGFSSAFFLLTPDLKPINGVAVFYDLLLISTVDGKVYRLEGTDPTDYNFVDYYAGSAAEPQESMVNIGNDVMYVKTGGDIEKLSDTERSGDVEADDASRFIPNTKDTLLDPIGVYDQAHQRVYWFNSDYVLVYDKDSAFLAPEVSPWSKWTTLMPNNFQTEATTYVKRIGKTTYTVYWGDPDGQVFDLNGSDNDGDAGAYNIDTKRKTKYISELPTNTEMTEGRVQYRRSGACTLLLDFIWSDEYNQTQCSIPLKGPLITGDPNFWGEVDLYWGESEYFNEGTVTGDNETDNQISTVGFSAVGRSPGFFLELNVEDTENFLVDKLIL